MIEEFWSKLDFIRFSDPERVFRNNIRARDGHHTLMPSLKGRSIMRFAIWLTIILFAFGTSASPAKPPKAVKRKPASKAYEMRVSVVFGDRSTQFFVRSSGNDGMLKMSNERGR